MPWFPCPRQAGGGVLCARGLLIRTSLFPYSTVAGARALIDSQDTLPVFMATVVEDHEYNLGGDVESEASTFVRMLSLCTSVRVPLTDIIDSSP